MGRTFQTPRPFLDLTVEDNVRAAASFSGRRGDIAALLALVELAEGARIPARQLSAAKRRLLELAMALAQRPRLLLVDEILGGLLPAEAERVVAILRAIRADHGIAILWIDHVVWAVAQSADRVIVLHHGELICRGRAAVGPARRAGDRGLPRAAGDGGGMSAEVALDILIGGAITGGLYALIALGLNLQYGLMRILNVAHGEFLMLGAYLTYALHVSLGINPLLTVLVTGPAALGAGLLLHRTLYARVLGERDAPQAIESRSLLLSFGLLFVAQNAALLLWSADLRGYSYLSTPLRLLGAPFAANRVVAAAVALALGVGFYVFLRRSLVGKAVRALMQDPEGARLVGIDVRRVHAFCFGAGVAMSAVAGSLISMAFELTPFIGLGYTVTALVVIILGGLGNMLGSLVAGIVLGVVETAAVYLTEYDIRPIVSYGVLSLILLLKPSGLLGR